VTPRAWLNALRTIPRIGKSEWEEFDPVARWLIATRAAVLVLTLVSAIIAGLLAARAGRFHLGLWLLVTLGLLLAHATNNLVNDLTDHAKGVDQGDYFRAQYGPQPLEHGLMTRAQMLRMIVATGGAALACGVILVWLRGGATLAFFGAGVFFVLFYTWPLKYYGLGEVAVILVWGPLMVGGGYLVIAGELPAGVLVASLPFSLGATTVLFGKHIDKLAQDRAKGIRTLPVLLGEARARGGVIVMVLAQYAITVGLVATRRLGWPILAVAVALPSAWRLVTVCRRPRPESPPPQLPKGVWPLWFVAFAFDHNRKLGGLFVLGLAADVLLH
jgi:1,4-dihydroxy-2-naphthoate octaprenyltransferase